MSLITELKANTKDGESPFPITVDHSTNLSSVTWDSAELSSWSGDTDAFTTDQGKIYSDFEISGLNQQVIKTVSDSTGKVDYSDSTSITFEGSTSKHTVTAQNVYLESNTSPTFFGGQNDSDRFIQVGLTFMPGQNAVAMGAKTTALSITPNVNISDVPKNYSYTVDFDGVVNGALEATVTDNTTNQAIGTISSDLSGNPLPDNPQTHISVAEIGINNV